MFTIIGAMAELESLLISERVQASMQTANEADGKRRGNARRTSTYARRDDRRDRAPGRRNRPADPQDQEDPTEDP